MTKQVFAVHDSAAGAYGAPFVVNAEGIAVRFFADCVAEPGHDWNKHPADHTLFKIGTYDDNSGELTPCAPISYGNGVQFLDPKLEVSGA